MIVLVVPILGALLSAASFMGFRYAGQTAMAVAVGMLAYGLYVLGSMFIQFTGYTGPVFWCGCFACWVVCKLGGAKIPNRIRMGYAPYITADAQAGANGFTAVPVVAAQPGDIEGRYAKNPTLPGGRDLEIILDTVK